jgi:lipopolysaccharide export system protein LptA
MSKFLPLYVVLAFILFALGGIIFGVLRQPPEAEMQTPGGPTPTPPTLPSPSTMPQLPTGVNVEGAEIEQRDPAGELEWKVTAGGQIEFDKDTQVVTGSQVRFEMLQKNRLPVIIEAPVFRADYVGGKATFDQGVRGHYSDGSAHFQVNHLVYDFHTRKLTGTGGAKFVQGKYTATGDKIVLDAKEKKVRLTGGVKFTSRG